jgi:hypothetical protein
MLQDYQDLQEWTAKRGPFWLKGRLSSVLGYCVTLVTRTLPKCIRRNEHLVTVKITTNTPSQTVWVDHRRGDVVRSVLDSSKSKTNEQQQNQQLLYQGQAGIVAAATAPYYGGGLRLFPFARMGGSDSMHLRIGRIHPLRGVLNLHTIFQGSYRDERESAFGCLDFMGTEFTVEVMDPSHGYPVQHSGESVGTCQQVHMQVLKEQPMEFVTLLPPRVVYDDDDETKMTGR